MIDDRVLRELHRAAIEAGRRSVVVPSHDLDVIADSVGGRAVAEKALERLAAASRVVRIRRDLVALPDATGIVGVDLAGLVDAVAPSPYLITAGGALEHFELTDQHFFGISILTPTRMRPLRYRRETATFFEAHPDSIWGSTTEPGPRFALPERALVDVFSHPRFGVSLTQALDALLLAASREPAFLDRLLATVKRYGTGVRGHNARSSARRVGFIVERLFGAAAAAPYRGLIGSNEAPVLLRPGKSRSGLLDPAWRVIVNAVLEPETAS